MTYVEYAEFMNRVNHLSSSIEDCDVQFDDMHDKCTEALKHVQELYDALRKIPGYYAAWQEEVANAKDMEETGMDPHDFLDYRKLVDLEKQFGIHNDNLHNGHALPNPATLQKTQELINKLDALWKHYDENVHTMSPEDKVDERKICVHEEEELCKQYPEEIVVLALRIKHGNDYHALPFGATSK